MKWALRVTLCSTILATLLTTFITIYIYINQGMVTLNSEVGRALFDIAQFWFPIVWSLTLLLALFRGVKYIFNNCSSGYQMKLLTCKKEEIDVVGYGDILKVWRKWFMLLIWLIAAEAIITLAFSYMFSFSFSEWFDIYVLYFFILIGGYFSFIILSSRCKQIKVVKC